MGDQVEYNQLNIMKLYRLLCRTIKYLNALNQCSRADAVGNIADSLLFSKFKLPGSYLQFFY